MIYLISVVIPSHSWCIIGPFIDMSVGQMTHARFCSRACGVPTPGKLLPTPKEVVADRAWVQSTLATRYGMWRRVYTTMNRLECY